MGILEAAINLIAPHDCIVCGLEGKVLCEWCRQEHIGALPERCYGCQKRTAGAAVCPACRRKSPLKQVWVATEYKATAKQLLHTLKFDRASAAALPVAQSVADVLPYLAEDTVIVHVPAATTRVRARGYDQSRLVARHLSKMTGRHHLALLARVGQYRQVGAKRGIRKSQLAGAFRPLRHALIKGAHILLVDDVLTTGATLEEAARTLKSAGAKRVDAAVFAQRP